MNSWRNFSGGGSSSGGNYSGSYGNPESGVNCSIDSETSTQCSLGTTHSNAVSHGSLPSYFTQEKYSQILQMLSKDHRARELLGIIDGADTTPPTDAEAAKMWKVKAGKTMYALTVTIEDEFLKRIKDAKTPKEAWNTLATIFTKKNDARLQRLENELLSISQRNMTISLILLKSKIFI
uniref:Uncharacterized protein n=1 Tax=Solanum tuberosum TaxID=4113 RepID=M1C6F9_SOLTU